MKNEQAVEVVRSVFGNGSGEYMIVGLPLAELVRKVEASKAETIRPGSYVRGTK